MGIVHVALIDDTTTDGRRTFRYVMTDQLGEKHTKGPITTIDPAFDETAYRALMVAKVEAWLVDNEIEKLFGEG